MDSLWQAENGLVWNQLNGAPPNKEIGVHVFYRCQCTTVETVRELTEFAKNIPGFVDLFLNDQVRIIHVALLTYNWFNVLVLSSD